MRRWNSLSFSSIKCIVLRWEIRQSEEPTIGPQRYPRPVWRVINSRSREAYARSRTSDSDSRKTEIHHRIKTLQTIRSQINNPESKTGYHNGRCEIDRLRREVCDSSLKSKQSRRDRCDLQEHSVGSPAAGDCDAHCFPFVTLSSDGKVLTPVQSLWRRFGCGLGGILPSRDGNNTAPLPC